MLTVVVLTLLLLAVLLAGYRYLLRPVFVGIYFGVGPLLLLANARRLDLQAFTWAKVITLAVSVAAFVWYPRAKAAGQRRLGWALAAILVLNVLEAVVADAVGGQWVNALVGVSLIATVGGPSRITAASRDGRPAMRYALPWSWILTYTLWNIAVVCAHYPLHWIDHAAVLSAPLIVAVTARDRAFWLEARGFTLGLYAVGIVLVLDLGGFAWIPSGPSPAGVLPWFNALAVGLAGWNLWTAIAVRRPAPVTTTRAAL